VYQVGKDVKYENVVFPHLAVVSKGWSGRFTVSTLQIRMEFWHPICLYWGALNLNR
jgi:hypothetical protein